MSLRTQLYSLLFTITLVTFIGGLGININISRAYLNDQMGTHAQDAATSLGLSISPYMDEDNLIIAKTMISAIFDAGYYETIMLTNANGNVILSRHNPVTIDGVPTWFINAITLLPPVKSTEVNNGWILAGTLSIKSHSGTAYAALWQHTIQNFYFLLLLYGFLLIFARYVFHNALAPLTDIQNKQQR